MRRVIQSQTIRNVIHCLLLPSLFMLVLVSCVQKANTGQINAATISPSATTATKAVVVTRLAALAVGHITYQSGCLFLIGLDGSKRTLTWPPDFHPIVHQDTGVVEITMPNDKRVEVRLDDQLVRLGGGNVSEPHGEEYTVVSDKRSNSEQCPGPYWLVGTVIPQ